MNEPSRTLWDISNGTILRIILFGILLWLLYYLRDLLLIIVTAVVLASAIEPLILWFLKRRVPRVPAVIILYLLAAIVLVGVLYFFIPPLIDDVIGFILKFEDQFQAIDLSVLAPTADLAKGLSGLSDSTGLLETLANIKNSIAGVSGGVFHLTSAVFGGVLSFVLIVVLSFYFAVQETGIDDFLKVVTPVRRQDYVLSLWKRSQAKIGLWMQGQVLLGLIVAVLMYLGLTILSVPYALLLAILTGALELIPVFGPVISAIPIVIVAFGDGGVTAALMAGALCLIVQQFENHLIYPLVVRKVIGVHPILVIIALLAGAKIAGFLGIILSVPIAAALKEYVDDVERKKERERKAMLA